MFVLGSVNSCDDSGLHFTDLLISGIPSSYTPHLYSVLVFTSKLGIAIAPSDSPFLLTRYTQEVIPNPILGVRM